MKLRSYFFILAFFLLAVFGLMLVHGNAASLSWYVITVDAIIIFLLVYLLFFYRKVVRPLQNISNGMDLLKEQDFNSRLRWVGQREADKVVDIFNKMMEQLKDERLRLREQNEFLDLLIKASPMGVVVLNYDGEISVINPAALRFLGLRDSVSVMGKQLVCLKADMKMALWEIPLHETRTLSVSDGTVYKCAHETFIDKGFPRSFYLIESLTEEVRKAEKKAYEKVIRMISHEVNNTTAGITATLDVIGQELENSDETKDMRDVMQVCAERCYNMSRFITNFADVVRIPEVQPVPVNLNESVPSMMRFFEVMCQNRRIGLHFDPDQAMEPVRLDPVLFEQVLQNIIKNAVESIEEDGDIYITLSAAQKSIVIADTGKGIGEEAEKRLFSPFFSTKPMGQGIGLLFIREVLTRHGFRFSLRSYPDGLTRFEIRF